jgi:hypothetical protein
VAGGRARCPGLTAANPQLCCAGGAHRRPEELAACQPSCRQPRNERPPACLPGPCRVPEDCPQHVADLIDTCFSDQPALRPSADQVVAALQPQPSTSPARSVAEIKHLEDGEHMPPCSPGTTFLTDHCTAALLFHIVSEE